jgi:hypothetical protein
LGAAALADEDGLLAMLRIYMDESGTHDGSPVVTVAAYVGKSKEWQNFTRRWKHANKPIEVFHAADCQALRGEFKGWTPEQRDEHVKRLLPILAQSELFGQAVGINMLDYDAAMFNRPDLKHMFGSPYATCFHWTVATIMDHVESAGTNERIAFFHEQNDFQEEALAAFNWIKDRRFGNRSMLSLTFAGKGDLVPLQAADVLAYEANKKLRNPTGPSRRALQALDPNKEKLSIKAYSKHNMHKMIAWLSTVQEEIRLFGKIVTFIPDDPGGGGDGEG